MRCWPEQADTVSIHSPGARNPVPRHWVDPSTDANRLRSHDARPRGHGVAMADISLARVELRFGPEAIPDQRQHHECATSPSPRRVKVARGCPQAGLPETLVRARNPVPFGCRKTSASGKTNDDPGDQSVAGY